MSMSVNPLDLFLNLDQSLSQMAVELGLLIYLVLFIIIFCETGFVITPFLPGDSLLFIAGALAGSGVLDLPLLLVVVASAAILGDTANFWIGRYAGERMMTGRLSGFVKGEWIQFTKEFYARWGGATIVVARFVPYIRTFAPFLAGIGNMHYRWFLIYNIAGGLLWAGGLVLGGYIIGNVPVVQHNVGVLMWFVLLLCLFAVGMVIKMLLQGIMHRHDS
ncbi:MAG TPA: VTT domain-containing protein [Methanospirillum sp.]|uniref:VTT domain-containing protein n=1 Tax=Methanospirillum sp. TaxID=45200 RepID=UPI002B758D75|nr:VTT domain-containing protein [Methanospirillum sp.]HWQ64995.1 VTT domain-containing protein [Methanospirillum sp.]